MRRILPIALVTALAVGVLPSDAEAQFRFRGAEFWGGQYAWSGDDVESLEPGFRGGFGIWAELTPKLGIGLEGVTGGFDSDPETTLEFVRWDDAEASLVLRQAIGDRAGVHPFVEGRFGWTRISTTTAGDAGEGDVIVVEEDGLAYGGEIGVEIPLNRRARIVVAGGATFRDYGSAGPDLDSVEITVDELSGIRWGVRVGIALGRAVD